MMFSSGTFRALAISSSLSGMPSAASEPLPEAGREAGAAGADGWLVLGALPPGTISCWPGKIRSGFERVARLAS
ncbi:hypothetical protein D3C72_1572930 [compost metagenome]